MEYIDIYDENNNPTGKIKEKTKAHKDGDFHRTAHIWIINDKHELLLQKRSATKKSHPNCWDISGAGHIRAGETVIGGAIRELEEELGVKAKEDDFKFIAIIKSTNNPKNHEFGYVYLLEINNKIEDYFKSLIEDGTIWIALDDNKVIGYIAGSVEGKPSYATKSLAELDNFYIEEEYRRQGIGKRLVQEFKNYCMSKGIEEMKVTASAKNVNAREFYKSNGFEDFEVTYKMKLEGN